MELVNQLIYAVVQGLTEFLPVSSSGHLALLQNFFGEVDVNFDIFLHLATLLALLVYFYKDIALIIWDFVTFKTKSENFKLAIYLIIGSIPAAIVGLLLKPFIYQTFSNLFVVAAGFIITGLFLFNASIKAEGNKKLNIKNTFVVGISQALALLPGISRSGSTVSTGIISGISREKAIRFSFLLAVPAIFGAVLLDVEDIGFKINLLLPFFICFLVGLGSIYLFLNKIKTKNLKYFAFYCWLIALASLILKFTF